MNITIRSTNQSPTKTSRVTLFLRAHARGAPSLVLTAAGMALAASCFAQSGSWSPIDDMGGFRTGHGATLLNNGNVLVEGGSGTGALLYNPAKRSWRSTGFMSVARTRHSATLLPDGRVLVAGGYSISVETATAEIYDPATGVWTLTGSMNVPRSGQSAALLANGKVLVAGGFGGGGVGLLASAELWDPGHGNVEFHR